MSFSDGRSNVGPFRLQGLLSLWVLSIFFLLSTSFSYGFLCPSPLSSSSPSPSLLLNKQTTAVTARRLLFAASLASPPQAKATSSSSSTSDKGENENNAKTLMGSGTSVKKAPGTGEVIDEKWCEDYVDHLASLKAMSEKNEQQWIEHVKTMSHDELTLYREKANARRDFLESESKDGQDMKYEDSSSSEQEEQKKIEKVVSKLGRDDELLTSVNSNLDTFSALVSETTVDGVALDGKIKVTFNLDREPIKVTIAQDLDLTNMDAESLSLLVEQAMDNGHKKAAMEFEKKWRTFKMKESEMGNLNFEQMLGELVI